MQCGRVAWPHGCGGVGVRAAHAVGFATCAPRHLVSICPACGAQLPCLELQMVDLRDDEVHCFVSICHRIPVLVGTSGMDMPFFGLVILAGNDVLYVPPRPVTKKSKKGRREKKNNKVWAYWCAYYPTCTSTTIREFTLCPSGRGSLQSQQGGLTCCTFRRGRAGEGPRRWRSTWERRRPRAADQSSSRRRPPPSPAVTVARRTATSSHGCPNGNYFAGRDGRAAPTFVGRQRAAGRRSCSLPRRTPCYALLASAYA